MTKAIMPPMAIPMIVQQATPRQSIFCSPCVIFTLQANLVRAAVESSAFGSATSAETVSSGS